MNRIVDMTRTETEVEKIRNVTYAPQICRRYRWIENAPRDKSEERAKEYLHQGYDVFIHETAIDKNGMRMNDTRALLTRIPILEGF